MEHENKRGFPVALLVGGIAFAGGAYFLLSRGGSEFVWGGMPWTIRTKDGSAASDYDPTRSNYEVARDDCTPLLAEIQRLHEALTNSYDADMAIALAVAQEQYASMDCGGMPVLVNGAEKSLPFSV